MDSRVSGTGFSPISGRFWDLILNVFWVPRLDIYFCFGFVSRFLFVTIFDSKFRRLGLLKPGVRMESIARNNFSKKAFFMDFEVDLHRFWRPWEQFF